MTSKKKKELYRKIYTMTSVMVGVAVILFFVTTFFTGGRKTSSPQFNFKEELSESPGALKYSLNVNPGTSEISFIRTGIRFDPKALQLADVVNVDNSPLSQAIRVTPMEEANESGSIEIVLGKNPEDVVGRNEFTVATLLFKRLNDDQTDIVMVTEDSQVIGSNSKELPFKPGHISLLAE